MSIMCESRSRSRSLWTGLVRGGGALTGVWFDFLVKANMAASEADRLPEHELIGQMS